MGTNFWCDALKLEMKNVSVAFDVLKGGDNIPVGYQKINCHIVLDIKRDPSSANADMLLEDIITDPPATITSASVVSCESVHIAFLIIALNDLDIIATDIKNAYLNSPCDEKIWTHLGPEFGPDFKGRWALIVCSLYGLKSAGTAYCYHLVTCMEHLGFTSCQADPDLWLQEQG